VVDQLVSNLGLYVEASPWLAVVAVLAGGVLTATNPSLLALIPLMMSIVVGQRGEGIGPLRALYTSLVFVLGLSTTFTLLAVITALAGTLYGDITNVWNWVVAAVCWVMGLHLTKVIEFTAPLAIPLPKTRGIASPLEQ